MKLRYTQILQKIQEKDDQRGITPTELTEEIRLDKSTISYHLRKLENDSLVTSISVGRNIWYDITEKGLEELREDNEDQGVKVECGNCNQKYTSIEKAKECCTEASEVK